MELGLVWLHFGHMEWGALGAGVPHFGHMELGAWGWAGVHYPFFWTYDLGSIWGWLLSVKNLVVRS